MPVVEAAVAGGLALAGSAYSAHMSRQNAREQMRFQERMSNTAHQREVIDLKKAGLNPILSAKLGGSTTPPGAQGQVPDFGSSAKTAVEGMLAKSTVQLQQAQANQANSAAALSQAQAADIGAKQQPSIDLLIAQKKATLESGMLSWHQQEKVTREIAILEKQREKMSLDVQHSAFDLHRSAAEADFFKGIGGKVAPWMRLKFNPRGLIKERR